MSSAKNIVETFRDVVQDLLVPELKSVKVSVDSLRTESKTSLDALRTEMKISLDSLRQEIKLRDENHALAMRSLSDKLDFPVDIPERLATLEARLPRQ